MKIRFLLILTFCIFPLSCTQTNAADTIEDCNSLQRSAEESSTLETILQKVSKASSEIKTMQSDISYLVIQVPDIVQSETLQTGKLYYQKDSVGSKLRIRFDRLKQDDFPAEESIEDYYFDGVWLTKVDYKLKQINLYQQAPEDEPVDVFELINQRFPLFGLSETEKLQKDFAITIAEESQSDPNEPLELLMEVKEGSKYQEDYKKVEIWLDKSLFVPERIRAYKTQGDIHDIRFFNLETNKKLKNGVFTVETPSDFRQNVKPLETAR